MNEELIRQELRCAQSLVEFRKVHLAGDNDVESPKFHHTWSDILLHGRDHFAIEGFRGQVAVLCAAPRFRTYRDLFPDEAALRAMRPFKGVAGMTAAVVGGVQAHEVMKLVCGYGETLAGRLWTIDLRTMESYVLDI